MNIHYKSTIIFNDGIQLFDAFDDIDHNDFYYLCMLIEDTQTNATYITVKLYPYEHFYFTDGIFDLLDTIQNRSIKQYYLIKVPNALSPQEKYPMTLIPQSGITIPDNMLPLKGFYYHI